MARSINPFNVVGLVREAAKGISIVRATKYGMGPLVVLTVLDFFQAFDNATLGIVLPRIRQEFGVSLAALLSIAGVVSFLIQISSPLIGYLADRVSRARMVGFSAILSGVFSAGTGGSPGIYSLYGVRTVDEIGERVGDVPTRSLLYDYYPVETRGRVTSLRFLALGLAAALAPPLMGLAALKFGWRFPFLIAGPILILSGIYALTRLKEPPRGYWERKMLGAEERTAATEEAPIGWGEAFRTLFAVRTLKRLLISNALTLTAAVGVNTLLSFFLLEKFHFNEFERGLVTVPGTIAGLIGAIAGGGLTDSLIRRRPGRILRVAAAINALGAVATALIVLFPSLAILIAANVIFGYASGLVLPALGAVISLVIPPKMRGTGLGLIPFLLAPVTLIATQVVAAVQASLGLEAAILTFLPIGIAAALAMASAGGFFELDMRSAIASSMASQEYAKARDEGRIRQLVIRDVDVEYDGVQVLFNVDLTVDSGEIVALLGTNGAGKSTLLRAISGTQEASSGAILYEGKDITHVPPHEIAGMGVVHMPGGRGVFPGLSVRENLELASSNGAESMRKVFDFFPILETRIAEETAKLSGGEQQMVALSQAFLANPKLLMIDELSLGLAPAVVQQLLEIVRAMHEQGTTIILVEQSVNVALRVADRAVFMEKGEVKFDGPTKNLLNRPDIMRAVYLKGSAGAGAGKAKLRPRAGSPAERRVVLSTEGLSVSFGGIKAVEGVDLELKESEVLGVIGPNGAGKTTLFDLISGYVEPTAGSVVLEGSNITKLSPDARARKGVVRRFQEARLFGPLTVFEALCLSLEQKLEVKSTFLTALQIPSVRRGEAKVRARAERLIDLLEIGGFRDKFVSELSTGLRRIVDLACVLAAEPRVLLLDEPSAGIAQAEAEGLAPLLRRIRFETGCSMLIIEHDMPLISAVADELVGMVAGRVVTRGKPEEVLEHPVLVEAYLGTEQAAIKRSGVMS
ncbi:MAG TPA: MFS transporter [Actinomycetota bacterium]|nr:MFS transporter [Actinomycetota bacterium]